MTSAIPQTPAPPRPPSIKQIQAMMPGLKLYNPSDEWLQLHVHGRTDLWMPPDLGGAIEPHPATGKSVECDGMYEVQGRYLTQRDSSGKTIEGQDAHAVVSYVIHRDRYGEMGIVWIPGQNPEEDAGYRDYSRSKFLDYQEKKDEQVLQKRREFKANWDKNAAHQGQPCPPPTAKENAAVERNQERAHTKAYKYECDVPECPGYAQNDWTKFRRHMLAAHKVDPKRAMYEGEVGITKDAVSAPLAEVAKPKPKQRKPRRKAARSV